MLIQLLALDRHPVQCTPIYTSASHLVNLQIALAVEHVSRGNLFVSTDRSISVPSYLLNSSRDVVKASRCKGGPGAEGLARRRFSFAAREALETSKRKYNKTLSTIYLR